MLCTLHAIFHACRLDSTCITCRCVFGIILSFLNFSGFQIVFQCVLVIGSWLLTYKTICINDTRLIVKSNTRTYFCAKWYIPEPDIFMTQALAISSDTLMLSMSTTGCGNGLGFHTLKIHWWTNLIKAGTLSTVVHLGGLCIEDNLHANKDSSNTV